MEIHHFYNHVIMVYHCSVPLLKLLSFVNDIKKHPTVHTDWMKKSV